MKNILIVFVFIATLAIFASRVFSFSSDDLRNIFYYSYCDEPIYYKIDTVDPRFNLSRDEFSDDIERATKIWEISANKDLFVYDPKGDLSINLIYDERQALSKQIGQLKTKIQSEKQSLDPKFEEYQRLAINLKQELEAFNKEIDDWNSKGGAPPEEYQKLIQKQQELKDRIDNINEMGRSLKISEETFNSQISNFNQTISTFNDVLEERPEEGIFKGSENRIEIYFNLNKEELIHTIAHELGHALGIIHNGNPKAVMYRNTSQTIALSPEDATSLEDVCRKRTIIELIQNYFSWIMIKYKPS